ncbi:MAG: hypothetical protein GTN62_13400 [Gemmatimonadales bacterium]|nr:hypothetical protein [Gemmatimonadales bacterium]NIN13006.1 hypothetical protein [Gemmatimonadales bacterium]NIN51083.1 hypothetical protein [Gemmatimonadales bacterium]NIP08547.1 hypothetical protein [Gemmatimonadales bacterium]NIR02265.1 hypothetical protein [Gemmatimonadales bacterium]
MQSPRRQADEALQQLLDPIESSVFKTDYWEKAPLHVARPAPQWLEELPGKEDLDHLFQVTPAANLRIVRSAGLRTREVPVSAARKMLANYQAYSDGWTLVLNAVHRRSPAVGMLAARLSEALSHDIGVNLYFTPPAAQGFRPHIDGHDVFILQLYGRKVWRVYGSKIDLPLEKQPYEIEEQDLEARTVEGTLEPGHLLYIPRGFIHDGYSTDEASMHLTIGVHAVRWVELLHKILDVAAERDVRFRRSLTLETLRSQGPSPPAEGVGQLVSSLARAGSVREALRRLERQTASHSAAADAGQFDAIDRARSLECRSRVERRPGLRCAVERRDGRVAIAFGENRVEGPEAVEPALRFIAATPRFRVGDLPGNLADASKVTLCRRLVREGLLSVHREEEETDVA